jgi:hypothetical protein
VTAITVLRCSSVPEHHGGFHGIDVLGVVDCLTAVRANKKISQNMIDLTAGVAGPSQLERSHESVDLRWRTGEEIPTLHIGIECPRVIEQTTWAIMLRIDGNGHERHSRTQVRTQPIGD